MAKKQLRYGDYVYAPTGEKDWVDLNTLPDVFFAPIISTRFGTSDPVSINFSSFYVDNGKMEEVFMKAIIDIDGKVYESTPVSFPIKPFCDAIIEVAHGDQYIDHHQYFISAKEQAKQGLTTLLLDNSIMLGDMSFSGIGFVYLEEEKHMTIDSISVSYANGEGTVSLENCVGDTPMSNLIDNTNVGIVFYSDTNEVRLTPTKIKESEEKGMKHYTLSIDTSKFVIKKCDPFEYNVIELNIEDEESMFEYIADRRSLIKTFASEVHNYDSEFDDIF